MLSAHVQMCLVLMERLSSWLLVGDWKAMEVVESGDWSWGSLLQSTSFGVRWVKDLWVRVARLARTGFLVVARCVIR